MARDRIFFCEDKPFSKPCHICEAGPSGGDPVRCCGCGRSIGCHILPTPLLCPRCSEVRYGQEHMMIAWRRNPEIRDFLLKNAAEAA